MFPWIEIQEMSVVYGQSGRRCVFNGKGPYHQKPQRAAYFPVLLAGLR